MLGLALASLLVGIGVATPAVAEPGSGCIGYGLGVDGGDQHQSDYQSGIESTVWVGHWNSRNNEGNCERISSLADDNEDGTVEVGYVLGYSPNSWNAYTGSGACNGQYHKQPELFIVWQPMRGAYHCKLVGAVSPDSYYFMKLTDGNQNSYWDAAVAGENVGIMHVNFTEGSALTNGERHNRTLDDGYAHFADIYRQLGGSTQWQELISPYEKYDNDPDYVWCKQSDTESYVREYHC